MVLAGGVPLGIKVRLLSELARQARRLGRTRRRMRAAGQASRPVLESSCAAARSRIRRLWRLEVLACHQR